MRNPPSRMLALRETAPPDRFPERRLLPYEATRLVARRVLVVAPHADDETIGRYATVSLTKNVGLDFNWSAFATMFDGKTRSSTVKVVGDSTVRFQ